MPSVADYIAAWRLFVNLFESASSKSKVVFELGELTLQSYWSVITLHDSENSGMDYFLQALEAIYLKF